jgi:hypothetical protein
MGIELNDLTDEQVLQLNDRTEKLKALRELKKQADGCPDAVVAGMQTVENQTRTIRQEMIDAGFDTTTADAQIEDIAAKKAAIRNTSETIKTVVIQP